MRSMRSGLSFYAVTYRCCNLRPTNHELSYNSHLCSPLDCRACAAILLHLPYPQRIDCRIAEPS